MQLNENVLKLSGKASIDGELELGKTYAVGIEIGITNEDRVNNEDGSFDRVFKGKLIKAQIHTETGKIRTKEKNSQSSKLRLAIMRRKPADSPLEDEAWYQYILGGIRFNLDQVIDLVQKRDQETIN